MEKVLLLMVSLVFLACNTTKKNFHDPNSTKQVFISNQANGLPGKCYQKMKLQTELVFAEVLCQSEINKRLIEQVQVELMRLNYRINESELSKTQLGETSKQAIKDFQIKNDLAYGGLDWATINMLKTK